MVRIFDEVDVAHVEGSVDPIRDIEIIHDELRLKDLEVSKKGGDELEKKVVRGNDKTLKTDLVRSICRISLPQPFAIGNDEHSLACIE